MSEENDTLADAQRVYDQVNKAAEHPAAALTQIPSISKYLAKVLLRLASVIVRMELRLADLENRDNAKEN